MQRIETVMKELHMNLLVRDVMPVILARHFSTRIKEHTVSDKNSHIFKHLKQSVECNNKYTLNCFKIIDSAKSSFHLKLKEAFHIKTKKPKLNVQVQHFKTTVNF